MRFPCTMQVWQGLLFGFPLNTNGGSKHRESYTQTGLSQRSVPNAQRWELATRQPPERRHRDSGHSACRRPSRFADMSFKAPVRFSDTRIRAAWRLTDRPNEAPGFGTQRAKPKQSSTVGRSRTMIPVLVIDVLIKCFRVLMQRLFTHHCCKSDPTIP